MKRPIKLSGFNKKCDDMQVSVVVPTFKGVRLISNLLESLGRQSFGGRFETIIVVKPSGDGTEEVIHKICNKHRLQYKILVQDMGHLTHALNMGLRCSKGEIVIFTDDDAILPEHWIDDYVNRHSKFRNSGAISGGSISLIPSYGLGDIPTFAPFIRARRTPRKSETFPALMRSLQWRLLRPMLSRPHPVFKKYRLGIFITRDFTIATGPYISRKVCYSLPCLGVNMSFKKEALKNASLPEHRFIKVAPYWEQYLGAKVVLEGWDSIYDPGIVVVHVEREGLSKSTNETERRIMSHLLERLVDESLSSEMNV